MAEGGDEICLGVDIGGTKLMLVAVPVSQLKSSVYDYVHWEWKRHPTGPEATQEGITQQVRDFVGKRKVYSMGIAICGLMDEKNIITFCEIENLIGWNPTKTFRDDFQPSSGNVVGVNDAVAALDAVLVDPLYTKHKDIVVLVCGTGVGQACAVEGKWLRGSIGWAGNLENAILGGTEEKVYTVRELCGGKELLERIHPRTVEHALMKENRPAAVTQEVERTGIWTGRALASLISIVNPSLVVIGGGVLKFPGFWEAVVKETKLRCYPQMSEAITIVKSKVPNTLVACGAAVSGFRFSF